MISKSWFEAWSSQERQGWVCRGAWTLPIMPDKTPQNAASERCKTALLSYRDGGWCWCPHGPGVEPEPYRIVHGEPWIQQQPDPDPDVTGSRSGEILIRMLPDLDPGKS